MKSILAVFAFDLGASFIDRHIKEILPGRTVAVGMYGPLPIADLFPVSCPVFLLDRWTRRLSVRLARRACIPEDRLRDDAVARFLRRHGVTAVLGEFLDQFLDFVPLLDRMGLPYVVQGHGIDLSAALRKPGMSERYLAYTSARAILTRCEFHRRRLIELGLPAEKIHSNPGGVDVPAEPPQRRSYANKRFLAIGVMVPKKGPIYLLESFRLAAAQDPDISLDFVGGGPLFPAVRQFVEACGLADRVRLHGFASEETKRRLLRECGVFVQHSLTNPETGDEEGLPAAIQEAMAHGMAVVSTRHSGIPEAVVENVTGLLVDERNVQDMAKAFLQVTSSALDLGKAGHRRAAAEFATHHEQSRLSHWLFHRDPEGSTMP
jgi:colanic acid/amylovoran biosynthesis glycosyltransferase